MKREETRCGLQLRLSVAIQWMAACLVFIATVTIAGCTPKSQPNQSVYMLLDASCAYSQQLYKAGAVINYLLMNLRSKESLAVSRIDTCTGSFSEKDIIAEVTFDQRPLSLNNQKRAFKHKVDTFIATAQGGDYTDLYGGILQAVEYLNKVKPEKKYILIFSDLSEELPVGNDEQDALFRLSGFEVIVLNVASVDEDMNDSQFHLEQVQNWQEKIKQSGGSFRMITDLQHLNQIFSHQR